MKRRAFFRFGFLQSERRRGNKRAMVFLLFAVAAFGLADRFLVGAGRVADVSMLPSLKPGDYFLINKLVYRLHPPRRGDLVVVRAPNHPRWYYVKRVIGLPGETLSLSEGNVYLNGERLTEPYARGSTYPNLPPIRIPEGSYFLMGDNRMDSEDSRQFGPVSKKKILGKL